MADEIFVATTFALDSDKDRSLPYPIPSVDGADTLRSLILSALGAPFPKRAIQQTKGSVTRKGYDTTGIGYAWISQRLNEVLGIGGWDLSVKYDVAEWQTAKGKTMWACVADVELRFGHWKSDTSSPALSAWFEPWARALGTGEHSSLELGSAKKGAFTKADRLRQVRY